MKWMYEFFAGPLNTAAWIYILLPCVFAGGLYLTVGTGAVQFRRFGYAMKNTIGSNVETLYNVIQGKVEASEFIVKGPSAITGKPLSQLQFKKNVLIASILRGKQVIIPRGHDTIEQGDHVVIVSELMALHDITDVLR